MKKILFPFLKERHTFLLGKWWFRFGIVIYFLAILVSPFLLFGNYMEPYGNCYDSAQLLWKYHDLWLERIEQCSQSARDAWPVAAAVGVLGTVAVHYFIQAVLFKVVIDFIVLGPRPKTQGTKESSK